MPRKFPIKKALELIDPSRNDALDPQSIIALVPVRPYEIIADIGAGPGALTIPFAKYVFDGKVIAVDVQQGMLDITNQRANSVRLGNLELILSKESKIPLDDEVVDGVILACVLNEATRPKSLLKESLRILRKGGWAAVIEWQKRETEDGPVLRQRISSDEISSMAKLLGARQESLRSVRSNRYLSLIRK